MLEDGAGTWHRDHAAGAGRLQCGTLPDRAPGRVGLRGLRRAVAWRPSRQRPRRGVRSADRTPCRLSNAGKPNPAQYDSLSGRNRDSLRSDEPLLRRLNPRVVEFFMSFAAPAQRAAADTMPSAQLVTISGPTLILAVPRPAPDQSEEASEAGDDTGRYFARAAEFLEPRGVRSLGITTDTLRLRQEGKDSIATVVLNRPRYIFVVPGKPPRSVSEFATDDELIAMAADSCWGGLVPR